MSIRGGSQKDAACQRSGTACKAFWQHGGACGTRCVVQSAVYLLLLCALALCALALRLRSCHVARSGTAVGPSALRTLRTLRALLARATAAAKAALGPDNLGHSGRHRRWISLRTGGAARKLHAAHLRHRAHLH